MHVTKRDGSVVPFKETEITERLYELAQIAPEIALGSDKVRLIMETVVSGSYDNITTSALDVLLAETCAYKGTVHPVYETIAARIVVSSHHKMTSDSVLDTFRTLFRMESPNVSPYLMKFVETNHLDLQRMVDHERDYLYTYFGFSTLTNGYLLCDDDRIVERPQHMLLRVAIEIFGEEGISKVEQAYDLMSNHYYTHATPTLFNAGTMVPQMSSCFLVCMEDDSIEGIYDTLKTCALISKTAGGIGLSIHQIRACGTKIKGTGGISQGIVPMLRVFNSSGRYVDQGGGRRPGAIAIYIEPWHGDIFDFLLLRRNNGPDERRTRDLFLGLWISDLFMERVYDRGTWSLFSEDGAPGLSDTWGEEHRKLYLKYEKEGKFMRQVPAVTLWNAILDSQIETGNPYILWKDAANGKSNQQNLGTIRSSNLCTEIIEYSSPKKPAICNLNSVSLPEFVEESGYNYNALHTVVELMTDALNHVIDRNYYPVEGARESNLEHRPIGIGVQGLADVFCMMHVPYESEEARTINTRIFETIYHAALTASCRLAIHQGAYSSYQGSPVSKGILQFDMWGVTPSDLWDWKALRMEIKTFGLRNSLLVAPMPTASTAQILDNMESTEPFTSNVYVRRTKAGDFYAFNKHLRKDLIRLGLWNQSVCDHLVSNGGSIQDIEEIPQNLKDIYKTVWEVSQKAVVQMAIDRGPYIDQSQSLNIHKEDPTVQWLTSMLFYAWKKGLKGMYYLRTKGVKRSRMEKPPSSLPFEREDELCIPEPENPELCSILGDGCVSCSG